MNEKVRKAQYQTMIEDLEKMAQHIALDQDKPSLALSMRYHETLLMIREARKAVESLQAKIFT